MREKTKTFHGRKTLSGWLRNPIGNAQRKRGFAESRLLTDWASIVGPELARHCAPQKLNHPQGQHGATLHLICEPGWAMELQFQQDVICEKIATFFGYRAVAQLRLHQGPLPISPTRTQPLRLPDEAPPELQSTLAPVADEPLREMLLRLGLSRAARNELAAKANEDDIRSISNEPCQEDL